VNKFKKMAFLMYANSYIEYDRYPYNECSAMVGVSKDFSHVLIPRLLENKSDANYSNEGPKHHPYELGWEYQGNDFYEKDSIYTMSPFSIFIRELNYGGEPFLKPLIKDMRLAKLETFPKFLNEFNLSCLRTLRLNYSMEKSDDIPTCIQICSRPTILKLKSTIK